MSWEKIRLQVLERDNYQCQICLKIPNNTDIHHLIPRRRQGLDSINNLTTVCDECHALIELRRSEVLHSHNMKKLVFRCPESYISRLKQISLDKNMTLNSLLNEAVDLVIEKRRKEKNKK